MHSPHDEPPEREIPRLLSRIDYLLRDLDENQFTVVSADWRGDRRPRMVRCTRVNVTTEATNDVFGANR